VHGKHQTKILEKTGFLRRFKAQPENEKKRTLLLEPRRGGIAA
jgi:hypothetical protein